MQVLRYLVSAGGPPEKNPSRQNTYKCDKFVEDSHQSQFTPVTRGVFQPTYTLSSFLYLIDKREKHGVSIVRKFPSRAILPAVMNR